MLHLPPEKANLIMVTGMTQCGKSTLTAALARQRRRVIVVSPYRLKPKTWAGFEQFDSVAEAVQAFMEFKGSSFHVGIVVNTAQEFADACDLAWQLAPCTLIADETTVYMPSAAETPIQFKTISQSWAHAGDNRGLDLAVDVIIVGQRIVNAPPIFRDEVQVWYMFRLNGKSNRKFLEDEFDATPEQIEEARSLPRYHFVRIDKFGGRTRGQTAA